MTLLAPIALAALLVPIVIYVVHWLFGSRKRVRVPAMFLWTNLPQGATGRARRRLPPFSLLLLLQLLAAALAAFALARPATQSDPPRHVALVLDASGSMQATDVAPTRFEAARAAGLLRLAPLRPTDVVSVIRAGLDATLLASGTPDTARAALENAAAGASAPAIRDALALASSQVASTPNRRGEIVLLTDGAWPVPESVGPLTAPVTIVAVGGGSENQALSALNVRLNPSGNGQTALVEVSNQADHAVRVPVRVTADGAPIDERQVDIPARTRTRLSIPLPSDARHINARLLSQDALALDDSLDTLAPGGPPHDVRVVGRISDGLQRALASIPSLRVRAPADTSDAQPDLTVLAGVLPGQLPAGPLLLVNPPSNSARLLGVGLGSGERVETAHPLLQGLDLGALADETPSVSGVPAWAQVILGTQDGPLLMAGKLEGHPVVAMTFDPSAAGLEKSLAFPLLISNATSFLMQQAEDTGTAVAEPFDPAESNITPRPLPTFQSQDAFGGTTNGLNERWPWLIGAGLLILGVEWLVFARRG